MNRDIGNNGSKNASRSLPLHKIDNEIKKDVNKTGDEITKIDKEDNPFEKVLSKTDIDILVKSLRSLLNEGEKD